MRGKRYKFKTKPYPHQVKALKKLIRNRGGALFMPMRTGKTKTAIDWVGCMYLKYGVTRVLVVCPKSVKGVWKVQIRRHLPDDIRKDVRWRIVNYERLYKRTSTGTQPNFNLRRFNPQVIIVDESHKIGDPSTLQSKEIYKLQRLLGVRFKLIMTGTPFHRKPLRLFGQFKFLDDSVFGTAYTPFKKMYALFGGYGGYQILSYINEKQLRKKIKPLTFLMKSIPQVPPQHVEVMYPLEESEEAYASMANEAVWGELEATNPLARATRLSQMASGVVRVDGAVRRVGSEKRQAFDGLVEQFVDNEVQKFVVFSRWLPPFRDIGEVVRDHGYRILPLHGGVPESLREQRIAFFAETDEPVVFISQTATGALGIDLSAASIAVFYTHPQSLVDYDQDLARIKVWGSKRTLTYYHLMAEGTVEAATFLALKEGIEFVDLLENHPDLLSYKTKE